MNAQTFRFTVDGMPVQARHGQTIIEACDDAGIAIPRLCYRADLPASGQCRLCTCTVNGRHAAACVTPAAPSIVVENETEALRAERRVLVELLFAEGNHPCPTCEKSGACDLQAAAYRLRLTANALPYQWPRHEIDASHPQILLDRNTCILCGQCVRASRSADGKSVFAFEHRGARMRLSVDAANGLGGTAVTAADRAAQVCPVGCILIKHTGYRTPYGERRDDV